MAPKASQRRQSNKSSDGTQKLKPPRPPRKQPTSFLRSYAVLLLPLFVFSAAAAYFYINSKHSALSHSVQDWSVYNEGLVTSDLSYKAILSDYDNTALIDKTKRHFNGSVLAYVTPWNSKGYDMAKLYRHKFTHVSPVWYQLKCVTDLPCKQLACDCNKWSCSMSSFYSEETIELHGRHDVDQNWIRSVRIEGRPMILPRVSMEGSQMDTVLAQQDETKLAINTITSECKTMHVDGIVLEAWNGWAYSGILDNPILRQKALNFVRDLGLALHSMKLPRPNHNMQLIFVIPPPSDKKDVKHFTATDMAMIHKFVDGFSLMTYDYSNPYRPGPSAPLPWVQFCLHLLLGGKQKEGGPVEDDLAKKILTGLNFYGNDFVLPQGGGPIIGHEYISLLGKHKPALLWDTKVQEHYFEYTDRKKHLVFYPSLKSLSVRLTEANNWTTGISIWEIGQGLEYFFDLL